MKSSKKLFFILAAIFLLIMILIAMDINNRTTWPGSKSNLKERIIEGDDK